MGAIVNRELKQRVRSIGYLAVHNQVAKQDIKNAAKIIQRFDRHWDLWGDVSAEKEDAEKPVGSLFNFFSCYHLIYIKVFISNLLLNGH